MYKKICDRCGEDITKQVEDNELAYTEKRNTRFGYDKPIHLCNKCHQLFIKFMENK